MSIFKRIILEDWHSTALAVGFALVAGVFVVTTLRALRMDKAQRDRLAAMPLDDQVPRP